MKFSIIMSQLNANTVYLMQVAVVNGKISQFAKACNEPTQKKLQEPAFTFLF
jgi:hypothetical protein